MDFPLALPVHCRDHGKRNWERCLGRRAHDPLGVAANGWSQFVLPPYRRKRATVLATVKVRPGNVEVCGTGRATADLDGVCARRRSGRQVGAKERLLDQTKERIGSNLHANFSWSRYVRAPLTFRAQ